jgi:hypothetical protein
MTDAEWDVLMADLERSREVLNAKLDALAEQISGGTGSLRAIVGELRSDVETGLVPMIKGLAAKIGEMAERSTLMLAMVTELAERKQPTDKEPGR